MITVGVDILDGSFEVDFDYWLHSPKGEEPLRYDITTGSVRVRRAGRVAPLQQPYWLTELLVQYLQDSGEVYLAVAKNEGIDIS